MTRLEYILTHYLGPAQGHGIDKGVSYWLCPKCGEDAFKTRPHKPPLPDRAKCWNSQCNFWGDALDMVRHFQPELTDKEQLAMRWQLLLAYRVYVEQQKQTAAHA